MDLSHPERTFGGRLDLPILVTLSGADRQWSTGEISRLVDASTVGTREALRRLAESGLVETVQVGRTQGFRFNRAHVLAEAVDAVASASARLRQRIVERVSQWEPAALSVVLFGSWARGEAGPDSDVDLLLVHEQFVDDAAEDRWAEQCDSLAVAIRSWSGNPCDLLSFSASEWLDIRRREDPLAASITPEDSVLLRGAPIAGPGPRESQGADQRVAS